MEILQDRGAKDLPDWFTLFNQDDAESDDEFYLVAFWDLSTCRQSGMGVGPIPWTAINEYAKHHGLDAELSCGLHRIIKEMDNAYIDWYNTNTRKEVNKQK